MAKARNRLSIAAILTLLLVSASLFPCGPLRVVQPALAQSTSVAVDGATLSTGQSATVNVWVKNFPPDGYGLGAYDIRIHYDPTKIQVTGVSPGDSPFDAPVFSIQSNYVSIVQFITTWPGPMGTARIAGLQITSLAPGQTLLTPTVNTLANIKGDYVTAVPLSGTVNPVATPAPTPTPTPSVPYPTVSSFGASGVTATSAILNGYLGSLGTASSVQVYFEWGLTTIYGTSTAAQTYTSPGYFFSFTLTGLSPSTTYYYRSDAVGNGAGYGGDVTFTTAPATPTVTTQYPSAATATSATLNAYLGSLGTASSVQVSFQWGLTTSYGTQTTMQTASAAGYYSFTLTGLSPNTTYHYRAYAAGNGVGYGQDIAFKSTAIATPTPTPAAAPTVSTTAASGVTAYSATLNGYLNSLGAASSVQVSFEWGPTTSYDSETAPQTMNSAGDFGSPISGLSPGTTYHFRAKAVGNGAIAYGQDMSFSTNPGSTTSLTPGPTASPAPSSGGRSLSSGAITKIVILVIIMLLLIGALAFLVWTWFLKGRRSR